MEMFYNLSGLLVYTFVRIYPTVLLGFVPFTMKKSRYSIQPTNLGESKMVTKSQ